MSNRVKILLAVLLLVVLAAVVVFQMHRLTGGGKKPEAPAATTPASEVKAPAETPGETPQAGAEAGSKAPPAPGVEEAAEEPPEKGEAVKLAFVDEEVESRFRGSRFFARNRFEITRDPFLAPEVLATPKKPGEEGHPLPPSQGGPPVQVAGTPGEIPEISLLPLPSEVLGEETHFTLMGVSLGRGGSTGLFRMEAAAGGEGAAAEAGVVMAHEGWLIGNDYVFLGIKGGKAQLLNRKDNSLILLSTGETV